VYFVFIRADNILSCHSRWAYGHVVTGHSLACFINTVYTFFYIYEVIRLYKIYESVHKIVSLN